MKVGIVCPYDLGEPGGVQQITTDLAAQLQSAGDEVVLIGVGKYRRHGGPGHDDSTFAVGRGFMVRANQSKVPLTLSPMSFARMGRALESVDIVHIHEPMVPLAGWAALRSAKPMVATFHADTPDWVDRMYQLVPLVGKRMRSAVLTAVSQTARRSIPGSWGEVRIIPNAIDASAYDLPTGRVERRIAFLGRDDPRKGLDIALDAFAPVHQLHPDSELVVMGADRGSSPPGVRFLGRVSEGEKRRTLASSAIYVAPNTGGESFGIVLAEAMASGCAVIASDLESFRAVIGDAGLLVPAGDVSSLSAAMTSLLEDKARRERISAAGRQAVERFDWSRVIEQYRRAYTDAIETRADSA